MTSEFLNIKYVVIDVDGTMTDAGIYYDEHGNELKKFCTRDAAAFFVAHVLDVKIIILTGRECKATERRMKELKVDYIYQNIKDKCKFLSDLMQELSISRESLGYIGDDLNDYHPMNLAGFKACPVDSCKEIKAISDYISPIKGGNGVVRDIFENFIFAGRWSEAISKIYMAGV